MRTIRTPLDSSKLEIICKQVFIFMLSLYFSNSLKDSQLFGRNFHLQDTFQMHLNRSSKEIVLM